MGVFDDIRSKILGGDTAAKPQEPVMPKSADQQSEDEKKLAGWVKSKVEEVRAGANRVTNEGTWMTNIAYLLGYDSVYYDTTTRQFRPVNRPSSFLRKNRIHANLILPACQNRLARMCKNPPRYEVRPNSGSQDDRDAAALGVQIINFVWDDQQINKKRIPLFMWLQQCGHAYGKISFDPDLGEPILDPMTGEWTGEYEGKVRFDVVSPFEVFADPLAKDLDEAQWIIHAKVRKIDYFRTRYPEKGSLVLPEDSWLLSAQYEQRINSLTTMGPQQGTVNQQQKNTAIELAYYETRSRKHPEGRLIVVANGIVLEDKPLPIGEIPFAKFDDVVIGGKYYSESVITHARPLQDQYNRNLAKTADWVNRLLAGKFIAAKGHDLIEEAINNESGEVVEYTPVPGASEPHAMQIPVLPAYVFQDREAIKSDLNEGFGLSDVSRGILPSAGIPAVGMQLLVEQDSTRIGIETEQHEHAWANIGRFILKATAKFVNTPRKLKQKGKTGDFTVNEFVGEDLRMNFDVTVVRGSTIPNNKFLRRQEVMNAYNQGLLGDPADPIVREEVLSRLEFGDVEAIWLDHQIDMQQINRTMKELESGIQPQVDEMENHQLHIKVKNRYIKSEKYLTLPPEIKAGFIIDRETHLNMIMNLQNPGSGDPDAAHEMPDELQMDMDQPAPGPETTVEDINTESAPMQDSMVEGI